MHGASCMLFGMVHCSLHSHLVSSALCLEIAAGGRPQRLLLLPKAKQVLGSQS